MADEFAQDPNIIFRPQITVAPPGGPSTRLDFMTYHLLTREFGYIDGKSTATARLSPNQMQSYPKIEVEGLVIKGKGKSPFVGGLELPPKRVQIVRPDDVD